MLTPAMTESRTSLPSVIIVNALWTAVMSPPFLYRFPFADETTTGCTAAGISMVGTAAVLRVFAAAIVKPAALVIMKSRRLIFLVISLLEVGVSSKWLVVSSLFFELRALFFVLLQTDQVRRTRRIQRPKYKVQSTRTK